MIYKDDRPVSSSTEDILGRKEFASKTANIISSSKNNTPLVIGITGHWGEGKTSVINMIKERLGISQPKNCKEKLKSFFQIKSYLAKVKSICIK